MSVFEYGSGGSTLFFARKIRRLVSVEHDKYWYGQVSSALSRKGFSNCEYILHEPNSNNLREDPAYDFKSYTSTIQIYKGMTFRNYVKSIDKYPNGSFDLVFVDGRARSSCIPHCVNKVKPGGFLMLDNSNRLEYMDAISLLADYKRTDFSGIGPYSLYGWQTSLWQIESVDNIFNHNTGIARKGG
jgi:predicted O-methyltransferase YrrM